MLDTSTNGHNFGLSTPAPFRIPRQGYRSAKNKHLLASSGFVLPDTYTINLWFRMDTAAKAPDTQMQYLYLKKVSAGADKLYIGVTNTFLRVYIEGAIYDYAEAFGTNTNWRHLSVSIYKTSTTTTGVQIILDSTKLAPQTLYGVYTDNAAHQVYVAKDFEGNIYSFEIVPLLNIDLTVPRMLFSGSCGAYGSTTSCSVCPRTSTTAGTCLSS